MAPATTLFSQTLSLIPRHAGQTHLKSLYSPIDWGTDKKRRSHLYSAGAKRRRMAGAGRILKNALAVAAPAAYG